MKKPKVLFVSHVGVCGGAERILLDALSAFEQPTLLIFEDGPLRAAAEATGARVIVAGTRSLSAYTRDSGLAAALPLAGRMARLMLPLLRAAGQHDVVYANTQKAFSLAAVAATLLRKPLIWHLHDILSAEHFGEKQRRMQVLLANKAASLVIAPSRAVADAFAEAGGDPGRVLLVPNGLDAVEGASPAALREAVAPRARTLLGVFSRLAPWKGQHVVIRAMVELPAVECLIAGSPLFGEDAYAQSLDILIRDLGLRDRVHMLGHRDDVFDLMRCVDVIVHPSVAPEPFGRTLVEGMLAQKPVIATDTGAASEILADGEAGILVPPGDAHALAHAVRVTLDNTRGSAALVERARRRALESYSATRMQTALSGAVNRVLMSAR